MKNALPICYFFLCSLDKTTEMYINVFVIYWQQQTKYYEIYQAFAQKIKCNNLVVYKPWEMSY